MDVKVKMYNRKQHTVEFEGCKNLEEVRAWLNKACPFINIGERAIINTKYIVEVSALSPTKDRNDKD